MQRRFLIASVVSVIALAGAAYLYTRSDAHDASAASSRQRTEQASVATVDGITARRAPTSGRTNATTLVVVPRWERPTPPATADDEHVEHVGTEGQAATAVTGRPGLARARALHLQSDEPDRRLSKDQQTAVREMIRKEREHPPIEKSMPGATKSRLHLAEMSCKGAGAQAHYDQLGGKAREEMRTNCAKYGVSFASP